MKRRRVKDEPPSDEGDEEPVSSDSGLPDREALPQRHAVHAAPDARLASGVVSIEDVLPKRAAVQPRLREGTPPVEDLLLDTGGQSVEMLRLLRQPRYFDDDFEAAAMRCFRCGGTGHRERDCTLPPRERPCFLCGLFGHVSRECPRELCFNCSMPGHQARQCRVPRGQAHPLARCLRCGSRQHELASCDRDYDDEDMALMVCYLCGQQGHLLCDSAAAAAAGGDDVMPADGGEGDDPTAAAEPSCCRCGGVGHVGSECTVRVTGGSLPQMDCFRCGKIGHLARNCPLNQSKAGHATAGMGFGGGGGVAVDVAWSLGGAMTPGSARGASQRMVTWTPTGGEGGGGRHALSAPRGGTHQRWD